MILLKMLTRDLVRRKGAMLIVFAFVLLSTLLMVGGTRLIVTLNTSLGTLFTAAKVPHFVQMHSGDLDEDALRKWAAMNSQVESFQLVEMISVDGSSLFLSGPEDSEKGSVMDLSFVRQNEEFDFLLDHNNRKIDLSSGEIGVPVYYAQERGIAVGDTVKIIRDGFTREYTIAGLVRDAQMNPAVVHSKRFLISDDDYRELHREFQETEYLVEFRLSDPAQIDEFIAAYLDAGLPRRGPAVDYRLFKLLNALSDGVVAGAILCISFLVMIIALLCLRFIILAAIEEDFREIGVMKAIGINARTSRRIYLAKYLTLGGCAVLAGYIAALPLHETLTRNTMVSIGRAPQSFSQQAVPIAAACFMYLIIFLSIVIILRRFKRISAVEALRAERRTGNSGSRLSFPLRYGRFLPMNLLLGMRDLLQRFRLFGLLTFIYFFAAFITILPLHFLTTIESPEFITYMGIGKSDIRIDLRQTDEIDRRFEELLAAVGSDPDVARFTPLVSSQFVLLKDNGEKEPLIVETGDFSLFPLDYLDGHAPQNDEEIALSYLNSSDLEKNPGDYVTLLVDGREVSMRVCGVYQDITNGGRTAKSLIPYNRQKVTIYAVSLDLKSPEAIAAKVREYGEAFAPARITDLGNYLSQTLGATISQVRKVVIVAQVVGIGVAMLITSLFLRMLISKDQRRIAIMKSIGFPLSAVRLQYLTTAISLLSLGIVAGTLFANTAGQKLVSAVLSLLGAARIHFVVEPLRSCLLLPSLMIFSVAVTTVLSITGIRNHSITAIVAE